MRNIDYTQGGCPDEEDGKHAIEWADVPSMTWALSEHAGYGSHQRGFCWTCDQRFYR